MAVKSLQVLSTGLQPDLDKGVQFTFRIDEGTKIEKCFLCFLIRADEGNVLVDTGVHPDDAEIMGKLTGGPIFQQPEDHLPEQLKQVGLSIGDIDTLVMTHLHWDHAGWLPYLRNAEVVVQEEEYRFATEPPSYAARLYFPDRYKSAEIKWRVVEGDYILMPGVTLLSTPGHTAGCQSVMVDLPKFGTVLLPGDAGFLQDNFEREIIPLFFSKPRQALLSIKRLNAWAHVRKAPIFPAHDTDYWRQHILKLPEAYT